MEGSDANASGVSQSAASFLEIVYYRFGRQHVALRVLISILFTIIGVLLPDSSLFEARSGIFSWALTILPAVTIIIIYAYAILEIMPSFQFPAMNAHLSRFIPRHEIFGDLIQELTSFLGRLFPNSSPLEENSARTWIFFASRIIYRCTGDVISGSLACAALISFIISPHETPIYVFFIWAICVVSYLKKKLAAIPENNNDSTTDRGDLRTP